MVSGLIASLNVAARPLPGPTFVAPLPGSAEMITGGVVLGVVPVAKVNT